MRKGLILLSTLLSICFFISCSGSDYKPDNLSITYIKDANGSLSFLVYFQYPKSEKFEATMLIKTEDEKYTWKSTCQDFAASNKSYKVAGRFLLPEDLNGSNVKIEIKYMDKNEIYDDKLIYPNSICDDADVEVFNFSLKKNVQSFTYNIDYKDTLNFSNEYAYSYTSGEFFSGANRIQSKGQLLRTNQDTKEIHFIEKKKGYDGVYMKSIDLKD